MCFIFFFSTISFLMRFIILLIRTFFSASIEFSRPSFSTGLSVLSTIPVLTLSFNSSFSSFFLIALLIIVLTPLISFFLLLFFTVATALVRILFNSFFFLNTVLRSLLSSFIKSFLVSFLSLLLFIFFAILNRFSALAIDLKAFFTSCFFLAMTCLLIILIFSELSFFTILTILFIWSLVFRASEIFQTTLVFAAVLVPSFFIILLILLDTAFFRSFFTFCWAFFSIFVKAVALSFAFSVTRLTILLT
mmetsp:Transcript_12838/g.13354  ORF Transcript_12838/g.13354 Transcript_12838/m.13354 type:complete len:248 (+) Transcript_12838:863-1606(+)